MQLIKYWINKFNLDGFHKWEKVLCFCIFLSFFFLLVLYSFKKSTFFASIPIDGAFQHLNPLRRISAGEIPGKDFQIFHGLALSYLHYPIYVIFGKTLFASEISRYFINGLSAFAAVLAIFGGLKRPIVACGLSAFFILSTKLAGIFWLIDPYGDAYSSLAVRTLVPALCLGYLFYINRTKKISSDRTISQIVIPLVAFSSVAMVIATEQGMALFMASASTLILVHPGQPKWYMRFRDALLFCIITPLVYVVIVYALTLGQPGLAISFYWGELQSDQFWYFGAYPNIFPRDFSSLVFVPGSRRPSLNYILIAIATVLVLFLFFRSKDNSEKNEYRIWMFGLAYGSVALISNLGMISSHYSEAVTRIACAIIIAFTWSLVESRLSSKSVSHFRVFSLSGIMLLVIFLPHTSNGLISSAVNFKRDYFNATMEKRYSGVILAGAEYKNLFSIASTVIPPKTLLADQIGQVGTLLKKEQNYLIFHNPQAALVNLIGEGEIIEVNGKPENVEQVSPSHLLTTYSGNEDSFHYRYENQKITTRVASSTPFYSRKTGIWTNGIASSRFDRGGCIMVGQAKQLTNISKYRVVQFSNEEFERYVTSVYENIVCVDGPLLEPFVHGFPQRFTIKPAIVFSSNELMQQKNSAAMKSPTFTAERLHQAEIESKYKDTNDEDQVTTRTKERDSRSLISKSKSDPKSSLDVYFETWSPSSCSYDERPTLWATYTGFLELHSNVVNRGGADYIIHALGKKRRADYLNAFEIAKPTFVHTLRPSYTAYERWIQTATWRFYEDILANYDLVRKTDYSLIWRRKGNLPKSSNWVDSPDKLCQSKFDPWVAPEVSWDGELLPEKDVFSMVLKPLENQSALDQVFVLEVAYSIENKLEKVPVFGKVARFFIKPIGTETPLPISLPPYENKVIFPLVVLPGKTPSLQFETISLFGQAGFIVESIKYRKIVTNVDAYKDVILDRRE